MSQQDEDLEKERLQLVIEGTRLGMWDWNPQTDEVMFNRLWAEMLGHQLEEIPFTLEAWSSRVHPDDLAGCYADIKRHMSGETEFYENLHRMRHKDGSWRYILDRGGIVARDAEGRPTRFTGTHTDLTAQVEAEHAAKAALRAKDQFLARVSHEIRTPLHGVLGLMGLLEARGVTPEQAEITRHVRESGETLLAMINDLLDMAKGAEGQLQLDPRPCRVRSLVDAVGRLFQPVAGEKGVLLEWEVCRGAPEAILVDDTRLKQVLGNLLSNAVKFTHEGGIRLTVGGAEGPEGPRLCFTLQDDGIGIRNPDRVWLAFEQDEASTSRTYGGTGLGLSIVRQLVELLGGEITLQSKPGLGSTFTWWIPAPPVRMEMAQGRDSGAEADLAGVSVVVVDDHPINQMVAGGLLESWGAQVRVLSDGAQAVEACKNDGPFDVVLMDLNMPVLDGDEATRQIRRRYPASAQPIVAVTADAFPETRQHCIEAGFNAVLCKPFSPDELRNAVVAAMSEDGEIVSAKKALAETA